VFGVGATERHGPHLPLATGALLADWLSEATARRLGHALAAPTIRVGGSRHHLSFPVTISIEASTLKALIANYVTTLLGHGFRRVIVIPSHGGNFEVVSQTVAELGRQLPEKQVVIFCDLKRLLEVSHKVCNQYGISAGAAGVHAGELETSILLFLRPDLVDMTRAEEGFTGDITPIQVSVVGTAGREFYAVTSNAVDMTRPSPEARSIRIRALPQEVRIDLNKAALIVIDMQNDFCAPGGWLNSLGVEVAPVCKHIAPLKRVTSALRAVQVPILWVNWGVQPDRLNLSPGTRAR
jgi:creatinine amidohydrolase/Fe(II)-dependent formamide hydrolase-like protein